MKNLNKTLVLFMVPALILTSCGGNNSEESKESAPEKKVNAELEKQIDALAACEQQNTNCEAYTKTSEYIQVECKDEKKREAIITDLFTLIEKGPSKKTQAAAHAVNFWTMSSDFRKNPEYGTIVLNALKKEKDEEGNYAGSQLGQLLASWYTTEDKKLFTSILNTVKSGNTELRGRLELIRLCPSEALANSDLFHAFATMINNSEEKLEVRVQCLNIIWRVENEDMKASARTTYETFIADSEIQIAGSSMLGLGYLKSFASYELIEKTLLEKKDDQNWCYYGSYCLSELVRSVPDSLDLNKVLALTKTLITNKNVTAYYRSYYVYTLISLNTPGAKALLNQLKSGGEKEIVDEINNQMKK